MRIKIGNKLVGNGCPAFVICEAGVNHNGDLETAKRLIDAAKKSGADAVKFQTYQTKNFVTKDWPVAAYQKKEGYTNQFDMLKSFELSYKDFEKLKRYADKKKIMFLSTPHSCKADVDLVSKLCPAIKVGSGALVNYELLKYISTKKLPIILSTGMADMNEIIKASIYLFKNRVIILHCVSEYPCPLEHTNLRVLNLLRSVGGLVGFSDHSTSTILPAVAVAMGACVIEKHFTLDKSMIGPDHKASLDPAEFKQMVQNIRDVEKALGVSEKKPTKSEKKLRNIVRTRGLRNGKIVVPEELKKK